MPQFFVTDNKPIFVHLSYFFIYITSSTDITRVILLCNPWDK